MSDDQKKKVSQNDVSQPDGAARSWVQSSKLWGPRERPLKVHFLNPEVLEEEGWMCGNAPMNVDNVLSWATGAWNSNAFRAIPKFRFTDSPARAHIRVYFGGECVQTCQFSSLTTIFI